MLRETLRLTLRHAQKVQSLKSFILSTGQEVARPPRDVWPAQPGVLGTVSLALGLLGEKAQLVLKLINSACLDQRGYLQFTGFW